MKHLMSEASTWHIMYFAMHVSFVPLCFHGLVSPKRQPQDPMNIFMLTFPFSLIRFRLRFRRADSTDVHRPGPRMYRCKIINISFSRVDVVRGQFRPACMFLKRVSQRNTIGHVEMRGQQGRAELKFRS